MLAWEVLKMPFGRIYQRMVRPIVVAATAAALLVVNWFCKPLWRRPAPTQQGSAIDGAPEREALLEAEEAVDAQPDGNSEVASTQQAYEAPELSQPSEAEQLPDAAPVIAPEDIVMQPASTSSQDGPAEDASAEDAEAELEGRGMSSSPAAPATALASSVMPAADAVDEDYIKHLIDQELGPPKFAVRKQEPAASPPPASDEQSLQALLDQAFGPPKFAVPKPTPAKAPAGEDVEATLQPWASGDAAPAVAEVAAAASGPPTAPASVPPLQPQSQRRPSSSTGAAPGPGLGLGHSHGVKRSAQEAVAGVEGAAEEATEGAAAEAAVPRPVLLTMSVTHGPAVGKSFVADDPSTEYKIGRLPDCSFQILDQEISGRHASLRWANATRQWKLHDVGSLNGTSVSGTAIGRDYKVPGQEVPLADGDTVELGTVTRMRVTLREGGVRAPGAGGSGSGAGGEASASGAGAAAASGPAKRQHTTDPRVPLSGEFPSGTLSGLAGLSGALPPPTALLELPRLGARLCVHNRLGADHKRMNQGCEDVPYWELPYGPYNGAGILCVFDGHHGSKTAQLAREHLPAILRFKLLRRDGRRVPPLPPPPPPPRPRRADGEEEKEQEEPAADQSPTLVAAEGNGDASSSAAGSPAADASGDAAAVEEADVADLLPPPPDGPPLPPLLRGRDPPSQKALLKDTFLAADKYMSMDEGCTATLVMLEADPWGGGWLMQSANVGDSSAVLVNLTRGSWTKLSEDHRIASSVSERQRLATYGHTVRNRLYGLNISRMLGDRFLKDEGLGFLAEPHVSSTAQVAPGDVALLVVASDGLWDVLPEDRAAKLLLQEAAKAPGFGCQSAADLLLAHALVLRSKDDITVAVLEMGQHLAA